MHYIGVNYHKKYSYVVVKDKDGKVGRRGKVNNRREEFRQFLKPYQQGKAVLEATRNWGLIYDWLEEILGIGKTRFFSLLKQYRHDLGRFSLGYHRETRPEYLPR